MLFMAVPDEIAQYAEGHRITAYTPLDDFTDGDDKKPSWLWTTALAGLRDAEFDSFRVFVWNTKRHRYETGHVERNLLGYYPMERVDVPGDTEKGFPLIFADKTGEVMKHTYSFAGRRVKLVSKIPYQRPAEILPVRKQTSDTQTQQPPAMSWWERALALVKR